LISGVNANVAVNSLCESTPCGHHLMSFAQIINPL